MKRLIAAATLCVLSCRPTGPSRTNDPGGPGTPPMGQASPSGSGALTSGGDRAAESEPDPGTPDLPRGTHRVPVPGFEDALAAFPDSGRTPLPIVLAVHGAGDSPEWQCRTYRELLGSYGVVLCPAGKRLSRDGEGRFFPEHFTLERIVLATLDAFVKAFPDSVDPTRVVYTGYSQGATMGALMLPAHGKPFRRLALVEGGFSEWSASRARHYKETGGERVLFACGTRGCLRSAERSSGLLQMAGVESRVISDPAGGHTYGGSVGHLVVENLPWLLQGL